MANRPIVSWTELTPADGDAFSEGDDRIREMKKQLREIFETDHVMESSGKGSMWGYHKKATLIEQGSDSYIIDATNNKFNFDIGGGELVATVASATYTDMGSTQADAGSLCEAIYDAIVAAEGAGTYTVVHDGTKMTITRSAGTFSILWKTGTHGSDGTDVHIGSVVRYSDLADDTGSLSYTADYVSGNPAVIADAFMLYTKQVNAIAELFMQDEDSNIVQLTSNGNFIGGVTNEIRMWSGLLADIPIGWVICDGTGSTVNLIAKFLIGVPNNSTDPGSEGGLDSFVLAEGQMGSHGHSFQDGGTHVHNIYTSVSAGSDDAVITVGSQTAVGYSFVSSGDAHAHSLQSTGSGTGYENRPAYHELIFIQRS